MTYFKKLQKLQVGTDMFDFGKNRWKLWTFQLQKKVSKAPIRVNVGDLSAKKPKNVFIQFFYR